MVSFNPRIELNLWLANHEVNVRMEQSALKLVPDRHLLPW